jgi:hypothetical protein
VALPEIAFGGEGDLERVLARLKRQQDAAKAVRFRVEGKRFVPKGGYSEYFGPNSPDDNSIRPPQDETIEQKQDFLLDFRGGRYRRVYEDVIDGQRGTWIDVLDGKKLYGSKIDVPIDQAEGVLPASISIVSGGDHVNIFNSPWWPYFQSQGFILTRWDRPYYYHNFRPPIDAENVFVHRQETVRGRACDILQTFPVGPKKSAGYFEYAIDREDGSVRRAILWVGGVKDVDIHIDYRRAGNRMVPTRWTNERYTAKARRPWNTETMTVTAIDYDPATDESRFSLTPQAGAIVKERQLRNGPITDWDQMKDERTTTYRADESGRLVEGELVNGEFRPRRRYLWWLLGGFGLLALLAGWVTYRRVRSRRSPAPGSVSAVAGGPSC